MPRNTPNSKQLEALRLFASANGRNWKSELNTLWMNGAYSNAVLGGAYPAHLQQVRNQFGPSWLVRFSLRNALIEETGRALARDLYDDLEERPRLKGGRS